MENKKMYVDVYQEKKLVNTWNNQQDIIMQLLSYLFRNKKSVYNNFKIKIKDNGDDAIITIDTWFINCNSEKSITTLKFYNIPMKYGWIDTFSINKLLEDEIRMVK